MKKLLWMAALIMAALPAGAQQVKYTVNGVYNKNGATVKLMNRQSQEVVTTVVADGKFTISGNAEKDALMAIGDENSQWATLFFNDGTPVTVNLNDSTLKGSPTNERLVSYDLALGTPSGAFMKRIQAMSNEERNSKMDALQSEMKKIIDDMKTLYSKAQESYKIISSCTDKTTAESEKQKVIKIYKEISSMMQKMCHEVPGIKIYSFETEESAHAEASRVISKLRDINTNHNEFMYYIQRAYEMLFKLAYITPEKENKSHLFIKTPVNMPVQQYSVHQIPDVNEKISNSVMCVMLRGALLPSMIMSKEIQDYSKDNYKTPFALFKIKRDDTKHESDME